MHSQIKLPTFISRIFPQKVLRRCLIWSSKNLSVRPMC
ncbi:Uncharacterised protein [Vibrio cholerae]|nr:Uncharacterised protein [Vibrio cholerae]